MLVTFLVGGMALGALATTGAFLPAFLAFLLPAMLPLGVGLYFGAEEVHVAMVALGALFVAALYVLRRTLNERITESLTLSIEKTSMVEALRRTHEDLETKVQERTGELANANEQLSQEIRDRERTEQALRASEMPFRDFAHAAADWFWETSPDLTLSYPSERFQDVMGVGPEEALGGPSKELFRSQLDDHEKLTRYVTELTAHRPFEDVEFTWTCPDSEAKVIRLSGTPVYDQHGMFQGYRGAETDVTEAHDMAQRLLHQATRDALTGLINRREFEHPLQRILETAKTEGSEHALCYLDLDQFKIINDTFGHVAGDELLRQVAELLQACARKRDTLARLGGDEFGVLMEHCSVEQSVRGAEAMRNALADFRFLWEGKRFSIGVSIGLAPINAESEYLTGVLPAADSACYVAKEQGGNRIHLYREEDWELAKQRGEMQWVVRIPQALEDDHFSLDLQPIVPVGEGTGKRWHYELLLRSHGKRVDRASCQLPASGRALYSRAENRPVGRAKGLALSVSPSRVPGVVVLMWHQSFWLLARG
jgi:diguanylate cyclase (GGDEF)-like protein/PAS domain S-box-containing protein